MAWDVMSGVTKMAWDVMSGVTKTAWDVLSRVANLCGMFCPGCKKMAWDVLSRDVLSGSPPEHFVSLSKLSLCSPFYTYSKTCVKRPFSKRPKNGFQDLLSLMQVKSIAESEHSAILLTVIKLPVVTPFKIVERLICNHFAYLDHFHTSSDPTRIV